MVHLSKLRNHHWYIAINKTPDPNYYRHNVMKCPRKACVDELWLGGLRILSAYPLRLFSNAKFSMGLSFPFPPYAFGCDLSLPLNLQLLCISLKAFDKLYNYSKYLSIFLISAPTLNSKLYTMSSSKGRTIIFVSLIILLLLQNLSHPLYRNTEIMLNWVGKEGWISMGERW